MKKTKRKSEQVLTLVDALKLVNDRVLKLKPYHLTSEECGVKLNQNENPIDWPKAVKRRAAGFLVKRPWNRYPNFIPDGLKAMLARYVGVDADNIIVGNGSNEMLLVLMLSFAIDKNKKSVIICQPTFTVYGLLCESMGAHAVNVSLTDDLRYDIEAIKQASADNPGAMLIICSPNNPVGNTISCKDLKDILDNHKGICILDQAYVEFGGFNAIKILPNYANLIIARTFSKAMAGAGLRLGYMIGAAELIAEINKIKLPYNINFFTEYAASLILDNTETFRDSVRVIVEERKKMYQYLKSMPFDNVYPSAANFILLRTSRKQDLFDSLKADGILVRDVSSYPMLDNCLRISVGTSDENAKLRKSLDSFFN